MPETLREKLRITPHILIWMLGFIAVAVVGGFLMMDLSGLSAADQFVLARWSFPGLRIYLWLEGALLAAIVTALGVHVTSTGFVVASGGASQMFGIRTHPRMPRQFGYVFVFLGASLVALSLTTLVLLNSCRYMRLV
ncbi:MAG: hypothetical protein DMD72_02455 [Gemmatimonadetes bacterium]|nr:MAG: hypothetical protein DMD72_02455 [Gemmatimonadota bacterium]